VLGLGVGDGPRSVGAQGVARRVRGGDVLTALALETWQRSCCCSPGVRGDSIARISDIGKWYMARSSTPAASWRRLPRQGAGCPAIRDIGIRETQHAIAYALSSLTSPNTVTRCASVHLNVLRGFEPHASQSYHNHRYHLSASVRRDRARGVAPIRTRWADLHSSDPVDTRSGLPACRDLRQTRFWYGWS